MTGLPGDARDRLAAALAGHEPIYRDGYLTGEPGHFVCECGKWISDSRDDADETGNDHRRHIADVLLQIAASLRARAAALTPTAEGDRHE